MSNKKTTSISGVRLSVARAALCLILTAMANNVWGDLDCVWIEQRTGRVISTKSEGDRVEICGNPGSLRTSEFHEVTGFGSSFYPPRQETACDERP